MALIGSVPRRCVNLPPGSLRTLVSSVLGKKVQQGPAIEEFYTKFAQWLGVPHVLGAASGRSAFQLALEALGLGKGAEIIFPAFTIGLASWLAVVEWRYLKTGNDVYQEIYRMWVKIFAVTFGMGVVSGVVYRISLVPTGRFFQTESAMCWGRFSVSKC